MTLMMFIKKVLTIILLSLSHVSSSSDKYNSEGKPFFKCCDDGFSFMKTLNFTDKESFQCVDSDVVKKHNVLFSPLLIGSSVTVQYGMPTDCEEVVVSDLSDGFSLDIFYCIERLVLEQINDTVVSSPAKTVGMYCKSDVNQRSQKLDITNIRKCCPKGQKYDISYHGCRNSSQSNIDEGLINKLENSNQNVFEIDYGLLCKADEFITELKNNEFSLTVLGNTLEVKKRNNELLTQNIMKGSWCVDEDFGSEELIFQGCIRDCSAIGVYCVKKCCPAGQHYEPFRCGSDRSACVPDLDEIYPFDLKNYTLEDPQNVASVLGIGISIKCMNGKFVLRPEEVRHLTPSGLMVSISASTNSYCLEYFDRRKCGQSPMIETLGCFNPPKTTIKNFRISFAMITISSIFLFLTLMVYCWIAELRNLHGRTLICHVSVMLLAYCCLARTQYARVMSVLGCTLLGYGIYFGFVAAFSWLNVMCFDIWWTFGSVRSIQPMHKARAERRRFAIYSLYAWGLSVLVTGVVALLDFYPVVSILDSEIGKEYCWFGADQNSSKDWPHYIFFVFPMGVMTTINFVLWVLTARHCHRVKAEVHRLQAGSAGERFKSRFKADRARYLLTGKLWVVMGVGWLWEFLSTIVTEPQGLWFVIDTINELQGVWIFLILVLKPKIYYLVRKKLGLKESGGRGQRSSAAGTSSTFLSRTISSEERTNQRISQPIIDKIKD